MFKLTVKSLLERKVRMALTMLAIVLGVSFTVGSFILADSLRSTFNQLVTDIESGTDLTARNTLPFGDESDRKPISDQYLAPIRLLPGIQAAAGRLTTSPVVPIKANGDDVTTKGAPLLGVSYAEDDTLSRLTQKEGRRPNGPTEFNMDIDSARDNGFKVGEKYALVGPAGRRQFTLVGTVAFKERNDTAGAVLSVFDTQTAQDFFNKTGVFDEIDVHLAEGADLEAVRASMQSLLPDTAEVVDQSVKIQEGQDNFGKIASIFGTILLVFALIMVFVAAFIINNTFQIVLGQRVRELGLLRALGASTKQVRRSVLLEALIIGVSSTIIGLILGVLLSIGMHSVLNHIGFSLPSGPLQLKLRTIIAAIVVGVGITLIAAIAPARRTRKLSPMAAIREDIRLSGTGLRRRIIIGVTLSGLGLLMLALGLFAHMKTAPLLSSLGLGAVLLFIGVYLLSPLVAAPVSRVIGRPVFALVLAVSPVLALVGVLTSGAKPGVKVVAVPLLLALAWFTVDAYRGARGLTGQLARENAARNPRRTASTAAALVIGLALVSMATTVGESLKTSFLSTLNTSVKADWFIRNTASQRDPTASMPPEYTAALRKLPEVDSVQAYRFTFKGIKVNGSTKDVNATDYPNLDKHLDLGILSGSTSTATPDSILVHKDSAKDNHLSVGSAVDVTFPDGQTERLKVAAIYKDATILGNWVISNATWDKHFARKEDQFITLRLKTGADPQAAKAAIAAVDKDYPQAKAEDRVAFKKTQKQQIDSFLAVISGFLLLSTVIAFIGIVNTMSLSVFERIRELGLLRAVGTTRRQLSHVIKWEAGIVALFGGLLGAVLGVLFGVAAVAAIPSSIIKTTTIPVGRLAIAVVFAGLAGLVAAWFPARRAAKLNVLQAIAHE